MAETITVETVVKAPVEKVWKCWTQAKHITQWYFASDVWEAPAAGNDLHVGGKFVIKMSAKDKSFGFDLEGTYTAIKNHEKIEYDLIGEDKRHVITTFEKTPEGVKVTQTFDMEHQNSKEKQHDGWQAILENFKKHTESEK